MSKQRKEQMATAASSAGLELREQLQAVVERPTGNPGRGDTVAKKDVYDAFFRLYALFIRSAAGAPLLDALDNKREGMVFLPLGFVPGPAILLHFRRGGQNSVVDATSEKEWNVTEDQDQWEKVQEVMGQWRGMTEALGHECSPWNLGLARGLLEGRVPRYLTMGMRHFRFQPGDPEVAFGVTLQPAAEGKGVEVTKIYNPKAVPGVPAEGTVLKLSELKEGKGPVQKLLRTWALMEQNFLSRYHRDGSQRDNRNHAPGPGRRPDRRTDRRTDR